jgi:protein gp37
VQRTGGAQHCATMRQCTTLYPKATPQTLSLTRISQQQVEAFHVSLQQQLVEATHAGTDWSRPTVLFVNSEHACPELTTRLSSEY